MKRLTTILLTLCLVIALFCFVGCSKSTDNHSEIDTQSDTTVSDTAASEDDTTALPQNNDAEIADAEKLSEEDCPVITLTPSKTEVSPGETFTAKLNISNTKFLASITASVGFDNKAVSCTDFETHTVTGFYDISNKTDNQAIFSGYVLTTVDLIDQDIAELTFKVADTAQNGDKIILAIDVPEFKLGTDESGDKIYDVATQVKAEDVVITVK